MRFPVIVADPPWSFRTWSDKGRNRLPDAMVRQKGLAERHYKTMDAESMASLPIGSIAAENCVLFLWTVDCVLPLAMELADSSGFTYKTVAFTWVKTTKRDTFHMGLGYWTRGNPEMCLLFTRGKPNRTSAAVRQLIVAPRKAHSEKPQEQYARIEQLLPGPYLELFHRPVSDPRPHWTYLGNEVTGNDMRDDLQRLAEM